METLKWKREVPNPMNRLFARLFLDVVAPFAVAIFRMETISAPMAIKSAASILALPARPWRVRPPQPKSIEL